MERRKVIVNLAGGTGIMGKVHKPVFEKAGYEVIISGRKTSPNLEEAAQISDVTIVSVPIPVTEAVIKRVAPYCTAIMDFTSLKTFPIEAMLKYSKKDCEVGGLHPLYGAVTSIKGETVIYCPTDRSGEKCEKIIKAFELNGANIKKMEPELHDWLVAGIAQTARVKLLEIFISLIKDTGISVKELYEISPPPTKILLNLIARQVDEKNDELYKALNDYNPFTEQLNQKLLDSLKNISEHKDESAQIRRLFGAELEPAQRRANDLIKLINLNKSSSIL